MHTHYAKPPGYDQAPAPGQPLAPRLQNLGVHVFPVTTRVARAQLFINQGMNLAYGFNHAEAGRAFAEAARLDPQCAMAYWGQALVLGPNINATMNADDEPKAKALVDKAISLKGRATPRERRVYRCAGDPLQRPRRGSSGTADRAFADAMRKMSRTYSRDLDAKTMFAESLMDLRPWNYWTRDGQPYPETVEVRDALQQVLAINRNHPGALHYWVHLWEMTQPERAVAEADRLRPLMPGAGHMVHMPAHIYMRVGRFADVVSSNQEAVKADEDYIAQCKAQGMYPLGYYPHNIHFVWMGASAAGQSHLALESARKVASVIPADALKNVPVLQGFLVVPYWAMVRFGQWADILADKGPTFDTPFTRGAWKFARGMALTATGRLEEADKELTELKAIVDDHALDQSVTSSVNSGRAILRIAPEVLAGELAAKRKDWDQAIQHLDRAVRYEDVLIYQEPPDWPAPVRQTLGAVLLAAGRAGEAEAVYWEDLKKNPGNGWSLYGLSQALKAQGRTDEASAVETRFRLAWKDADVTLTASRM